MAILTLDVVQAWRPEALAEAAREVGAAQRVVEERAGWARAVASTLASSWTGPAADAANDRLAREVADGFRLADALGHAQRILDSGARDIGEARRSLLTTVSSVQAAGFAVGLDGRVTPPSLPPVLAAPDHAAQVAEQRAAQVRALEERARAYADQLGAGLGTVATADQAVAGRLAAVDVPQGLGAAVDAYLRRAVESGDLVAALGAVGAGGVALAQTVQKLVTLSTRGGSYLSFLRAAGAPITHYDAMVDSFRQADAALDRLRYGDPRGGFLRHVIGSRAARVAGRAFLPLTVLTGGVDVVTGGDYEGARGWATRGFGLAGATGAGALLFAGALGLGPVGIAVAGAAVLAYGAWSLGNLVWDNREAIGQFLGRAATGVRDAAVGAWNATSDAVGAARDWASDRAGEARDWASDRVGEARDWASDRVGEARDWASDRLSDAGRSLGNLGRGALDVVSFGFL